MIILFNVTYLNLIALGFQKPRQLPSARVLSIALSQNWDSPDPSVTLAAVQWGQFVASDLAHTAVSKMCKYLLMLLLILMDNIL